MADSRIDELRRRIERDPGSRLFAQLAEEHRKAGELAEAIRVARGGLAAHPVYASARLTLGRALLDSGDAAGARQELELALRQAPDNILASRFLGQALEKLGELEGALRQYAATLKMAPGDQPLAAQIAELGGRLEASRQKREAPPVLSPLAPTLRLPGTPAPPPLPTTAIAAVPVPTTAVPVTAPVSAPPLSTTRSTVAPDVGGTTLPAPAPRPQASPTAADAAGSQVRESDAPEPDAPDSAPESGQAAVPFSSSTLAELYLRQGLQERAAEVYRQVLADDPRNERARAGLASLARQGEGPGPATEGEGGDGGGRRAVLERQIAGLEAMLASVRRR